MSDYRERIYGQYVGSRLGSSSAPRPDTPNVFLDRIVREHFPGDRGSKIVDLGCGDGALLRAAHRRGYTHAWGIDRSPEQVALAATLGTAGIREGDLLDTLRSLDTESVDVVTALDVIEHFRREELLTLVDEVRRVLVPNGRWIVHVPNGESPMVGRIRYGDVTHEQAFTRFSLHQLFTASGFASVRCFEDTPVVHGVKSAVRALLWRGIRTALRVYLAVETGCSDGIFTQNLLAVAVK